jgi:glutathione S-transferase
MESQVNGDNSQYLPLTTILSSLFTDSLNYKKVIAHSITAQLLPAMFMHTHDEKTPQDRMHYHKRTEAAFEKKLEDIELEGKEREEHWKAGGSAGDLFTGSTLSLADCILGGLLLNFRYTSPD